MHLNEIIDEYITQEQSAIQAIPTNEVLHAVTAIWETYTNNGTIFTFGNGGSAATASHLSGDLVKGLSMPNKDRFKSICFSDNATSVFAISNDINFESVFVEHAKNFANASDILIGFPAAEILRISFKAIEYGNHIGATTIGVSGFDGGALKSAASISIHVPINDMEIAEDCHPNYCAYY